MDRAALDTDTLLKLVLVLVAVWLVLEIVGFIIGALFGVFGRLFRSVLGLAILVLIVLFLLDRI